MYWSNCQHLCERNNIAYLSIIQTKEKISIIFTSK